MKTLVIYPNTHDKTVAHGYYYSETEGKVGSYVQPTGFKTNPLGYEVSKDKSSIVQNPVFIDYFSNKLDLDASIGFIKKEHGPFDKVIIVFKNNTKGFKEKLKKAKENHPEIVTKPSTVDTPAVVRLLELESLLEQYPKNYTETKTYNNTYWKKVSLKPDILYPRFLIYPTCPDKKRLPGIYYAINLPEETGKKVPGFSLCLFELNVDVPLVDDIIKTREGHCNIPTRFSVLHIYNIFKPVISRDLINFKSKAIKIHNRKRLPVVLTYLDGNMLSEDIYPPGLVNNTQGQILYLHKILNDFKTTKSYFKYIDITLIFFIDNNGKTIINPDVPQGGKQFKHKLKIENKKITFNINLGIDLPPRNTLKRLESKNPAVFLVYTLLGTSLNFYYLINTDDGVVISYDVNGNTILI